MTNIITAAKTEVADTLNAAGVKALDHIPERVQPPLVVIAAGSPFIEKGLEKTFTDVEVRLELTVIASTAANVVSTEQLEDLIVKTVLALQPINWDLESVSQPFGLEANGALYLAARATVTASITLKEVV